VYFDKAKLAKINVNELKKWLKMLKIEIVMGAALLRPLLF
jgi:hypothetical protein